MGFFGNIGQAKSVKYAKYLEILNWMRSTKKEDFGLVVFFNGSSYGPDLSLSRPFDFHMHQIKVDSLTGQWRDFNEEEFYEAEEEIARTLFKINDDYTISFAKGIYLHKIDSIPFKLANNNSICISQVKNAIFDAIPEVVNNLWIHNAYRTDKTVSFKNLKKCKSFTISKLSQGKDLKGLSNVKVEGSIIIKNCAKLETTEGMPEIINSDFSNSINISGCPVLTDINIPKGVEGIKIFIDKNCKEVRTVTALPNNTAIFMCKTVPMSEIKKLSSVVRFVELSDYKGRGDAEIITHSNSRDEVIAGLKGIIDGINAKNWNFFDDLWAVITYFGLCDYAIKGSKKIRGRIPSEYVENGMIHAYDPVGTEVCYGYMAYGIQRTCIKKGVCNYLNKLGVKYVFVNDDPKKKKENEYIKIIM